MLQSALNVQMSWAELADSSTDMARHMSRKLLTRKGRHSFPHHSLVMEYVELLRLVVVFAGLALARQEEAERGHLSTYLLTYCFLQTWSGWSNHIASWVGLQRGGKFPVNFHEKLRWGILEIFQIGNFPWEFMAIEGMKVSYLSKNNCLVISKIIQLKQYEK